MKDKRQAIQAAAMQVFARKGYHAASIQEIAEEAGVAKGSVYLYFKSKDDLALSVLKYVCDRIDRQVQEAAQERGTPREQFARQLEVLLNESFSHAEFVLRLWTEQSINMNEALKSFVAQVRMRETEWIYRSVLAVYGEEAAPYAYDAAILLQGGIAEYMGYGLFGGVTLPAGKLASFMIERLDDMVAGMVRRGTAPIVGERDIRSIVRKMSPSYAERQAWREAFDSMQRGIASLGEAAAADELAEALASLELESAKPEPQRAVLRGLLQYMRTLSPAELIPAIERLEKLAP